MTDVTERANELARRVAAGEDEAAVRAELGFLAPLARPGDTPAHPNPVIARGLQIADEAKRQTEISHAAKLALAEQAGLQPDQLNSLSQADLLSLAGLSDPTTEPDPNDLDANIAAAGGDVQ
jgi:hypothetical protein